MLINSRPSDFEVQEMLDCVAITHDLDKFFTTPKDCTKVELLQKGWLYLFYDEKGNPLGLCSFLFPNDKNIYPFFGYATTKYCKLKHLLQGQKLILRFLDSASLKGCRAYISNKRLIPLAEKVGFKPNRQGIYFRKAKK